MVDQVKSVDYISRNAKRIARAPTQLLDEVLAELDSQRRNDLLTHLVESEQALLTTTDLNQFSHDFADNSTIWRVQNGRLED